MFGEPVDGRSLMPLARGEDDPADEAIGEYCAEMTPWPVFMIRRGTLKYIHCDADPPQLYDLANDPLEKINLATDPAYRADAEACKDLSVAANSRIQDLSGQVVGTSTETAARLPEVLSLIEDVRELKSNTEAAVSGSARNVELCQDALGRLQGNQSSASGRVRSAG